MRESLSAHYFRVALTGLAGALLLLLGPVETARASGCHASDRPVLAHEFSWEQTLQVESTVQRTAHQAGIPLAFASQRCPNESPDFPKNPLGMSADALSDRVAVDFDLPAPASCLSPNFDTAHLPPLRDRVERPPRPLLVQELAFF